MSSSELISTTGSAWLHFVGVGGSGMSALAQYHAAAARRNGGLTTGSDRAFDQGQRAEIRSCLEDCGVVILPQDGLALASGMVPGSARKQACSAVITSTAVESSVPDFKVAIENHIPMLHRSELLARYVLDHRTIAVSGTSGKSTVTAMIWTILDACGYEPGLLTGGPVASLTAQGLLGNARPAGTAPDGGSPWLVIEADESDGSLVRYEPYLGVILNLGLDHKPPAEIMTMFTTFAERTRHKLIVGAEDNLRSLHKGAILFGTGDHDDSKHPAFQATAIELAARSVHFNLGEVRFTLPWAGLYNVKNACAAIAACHTAGIPLAAMVPALADFPGVARRFQSLGSARNVEVIDDFAHNPDKLIAAMTTGHQRLEHTLPGGRLLAVFQPHGFGPTRFLREALVATFAAGLSPGDILWLPEIYFAGGTVVRDISSADLADEIVAAGKDARFVPCREDLPGLVAGEARPGDLVLIMGARDPSLTDLGRSILKTLEI